MHITEEKEASLKLNYKAGLLNPRICGEVILTKTRAPEAADFIKLQRAHLLPFLSTPGLGFRRGLLLPCYEVIIRTATRKYFGFNTETI